MQKNTSQPRAFSLQINAVSILKLIAYIIFCEGVGIIGSFFTYPAIKAWYVMLDKPFFSPPNWLFAPVWTILYAFMGISLYLVWEKGAKGEREKKAVKIFLLQLFANFLWSILFFGLRSPLLGLIDIVILLVLIIITLEKFKQISKTAFYLMIPYLLWVSFATILNGALLFLNM